MITAILTSIALSTTSPVTIPPKVETTPPVEIKVQPDTIPSAIQVNPVEFNRLTKDTITQINWWVFGLGRDTTQGCNTYVVAYDRKGKKVTDGNVPIPAAIVKEWGTDNTLIDDFILKFYNLIKR